MNKKLTTMLTVFLTLLFNGCSGCDGGYYVGGVALGLEEGDSLVIQVNLEDETTLTTNSEFYFSRPFVDGEFYDVTISTYPSNKHCSIYNNEGYVSGGDITDVDIICDQDSYTVGGTVVGLDPGDILVLQNNKDDDLEITTDGNFTFTDPIANHGYYDVTILSNSSTKTCSVSNGSDMIIDTDVTNVTIVCHINSYTIGGVLSGIDEGEALILQNNRKDDLTVNSDGNFTFSTKIPDGGGYYVSIYSEPQGKNCAITNQAGTVSSANITDINISCENSYSPIIFTSSYKGTGGHIGGISGADLYCKREFLCPQKKCKALITDVANRKACSTPNCSSGISENLDWVLKPNTNYVRSDRVTEIGTTNDSAIFTFPMINSISTGSQKPWTGLTADWVTSESSICNKWNSSLSYGNVGSSSSINSNAIYYDSYLCISRSHLYCVEQE
jgi:hypothetical protein